MKRFVFYVQKPKAVMIARSFAAGAERMGYKCRIVSADHPVIPKSIGVFYGLCGATFETFRAYRHARRAIYLDNGFLSHRKRVSFRFAWNGVQPRHEDLGYDPSWRDRFSECWSVDWHPKRDHCLIVRPSVMYPQFLRMGTTVDEWCSTWTTLLKRYGWTVHTRQKPTKHLPETQPIWEDMRRMGMTVSMASAASLCGLRNGIPALVTLPSAIRAAPAMEAPCTPEEVAPVDMGEVNGMCAGVASHEFTLPELEDGTAIHMMLLIPPAKRIGHWYARD